MSYLVTPKVECVETHDNYGRFVAEPVERGFGVTLGNALRRVLLSSLLGAAVSWVRIEGIKHEFSTIPHAKEDATDFLLNVKAIRLRPLTKQEGKLYLEVEGEKDVSAGDIKPSADFEIVNPGLHLVSLGSAEAKLSVEFNVKLGKGYVPAGRSEGLPIGIVSIDAIFTPIVKVNYVVEPAKVAEHAAYERLILDVWTDGTIGPVEAVTQSGQILREQFSFFASLAAPAAGEAQREQAAVAGMSPEEYEMPLEKLGLSPRVFNCLRRNRISKVGQLVEMSEEELLSLKKLGKKSVEELRQRLQEMNLTLASKGEHET
ncbi:MAG: DNA-directed RNA polymerase subunit alpha [Chloroflexi bacterium]|nr:DNA-directed RNA polymerase subunit alpha [Chloroflexota bacterium]